MPKNRPAKYQPPVPAPLAPDTVLTNDGKPIRWVEASALDFWRWGYSDLRQNTTRGHLAEYIVALSLGLKPTVRSVWDDVDVIVPPGVLVRREVRIQVKSGAYLQAWPQKQLSRITFGGLRKRPFPWSAAGEFALGERKLAKADTFVFAVQTAVVHDAYDPLDLSQWTFYVAPAFEIKQDSISLSVVSARWPATDYKGLAEDVAAAARRQRNRLAGARAQLTKAKRVGDHGKIKKWRHRVEELEG